MEIKVKESKNNEWGFVESFKEWNYFGKGYIEVVTGVTNSGDYTEPYVYRKNEFVPLSVIDDEIGIDKYIKAKKPFYTLLSDGFIVKIRAGLDFTNGEILHEKSAFEVYTVNSRIGRKDNMVPMMRIREVPESVVDLMWNKLIPELSKCLGNREEFLRDRCHKLDEEIGGNTDGSVKAG
jgi:hypothetical protein